MALALGAALAAYPVLATPRLAVLELVLGAAGVLALALALGRHRALLGPALLALGAEIVALDLLRARSAPALVLGAAGLLTLGELASFSISLRAVTLASRPVVMRAAAHLAAVAIGAAAVATVVELATRVRIGGGLDAAALGVGATVALLALTGTLAHSRARRP